MLNSSPPANPATVLALLDELETDRDTPVHRAACHGAELEDIALTVRETAR